MIYQHKNLSIILAGSFFPIHEGHIELLYSSKEYLESNNHKIVDMIILPTHIDSLGKKFVDINKNSDNRKEYIESFLLNHNKDNNINKIKFDFGLIEIKKNIGVSNYIKIIKNNLLEQNIGLIQICGVDSKINFAKNNNDVIIIDDGREIPENNKFIIKNLSNKIIKSIFYNKPTISSTIQRFINQELYDINTISSFNWNWISSTEINIGSGVQGIVKLMLLGRLEVAVKFCYIDKKNTKEHFINSCELMSIFVKIYHYEVFLDLGIIVYELGTSLLEIIPIKYSYKNKNPSSQTNKFNDLVNKFIYEKIKKISNLELENSNYWNEKQQLQKYFIQDKNNFKLKIFDKLDFIFR
jgi:nicotinic acid mononucleotide adenylyltransferase